MYAREKIQNHILSHKLKIFYFKYVNFAMNRTAIRNQYKNNNLKRFIMKIIFQVKNKWIKIKLSECLK
jgi:hypothetical protein